MNRIALTGVLTALAIMPQPGRALTLSETDIEAIGRVVFAEAGNQPVAGKVAVLDTILNRVAAGRFGADVQSVIEQRNAFEPVTRAGGWRRLPALTATQRAEFTTILALKAATSAISPAGPCTSRTRRSSHPALPPARCAVSWSASAACRRRRSLASTPSTAPARGAVPPA
jgi:hypothetical protein